jgi:hypothetical protein
LGESPTVLWLRSMDVRTLLSASGVSSKSERMFVYKRIVSRWYSVPQGENLRT